MINEKPRTLTEEEIRKAEEIRNRVGRLKKEDEKVEDSSEYDLAEKEGAFREILKQAGLIDVEKRNRPADIYSTAVLGEMEKDKAKKEVEQERDGARRESNLDGLTGLYSRKYFYNEAIKLLELERSDTDGRRKRSLRKEHRRPEQCAIIFIDLDAFKTINDTHGHSAGDQVLKKVASIIKSNVRRYDVPCRFGGDEFAIFIPKANEEKAKETAEKIMQAIRESVISVSNNFGDTINFNQGVSVGYASTEQIDEWGKSRKDFKELDILDMLIKRSDEAMYKAKYKGKNQISGWEPGMEKTKD